MKKIINGKLYNTETAKEMGSWSNYGGWSDFNHYEETLYRKKTGEFFLHGEGGASSKYAQLVGRNTWGVGNEIIPLNFEEARKWAEEKLSADAYENIFGEVSEDDEKILISATISKDAAEKLKRAASMSSLSQSYIIQILIDDFLPKAFQGEYIK